MHHPESFSPPQTIASVWPCTYHRHTGNSLCWDEQADHLFYVEQQRGKDAALWKVILLSVPSTAFADEVHIKASV